MHSTMLLHLAATPLNLVMILSWPSLSSTSSRPACVKAARSAVQVSLACRCLCGQTEQACELEDRKEVACGTEAAPRGQRVGGAISPWFVGVA